MASKQRPLLKYNVSKFSSQRLTKAITSNNDRGRASKQQQQRVGNFFTHKRLDHRSMSPLRPAKLSAREVILAQEASEPPQLFVQALVG